MVDGHMTWGCKQFMTEEHINVPKKPSRTSADMKLPDPFPEFTTTQVSFVCPGRSGSGTDLGGATTTAAVTQDQAEPTATTSTVILNGY